MKNLILIIFLITSGCSNNVFEQDETIKLHQLHIEKHGPIEINWYLEDAAKKHANWMANENKLSHIDENQNNVENRVEYKNWSIIGENIAYGQNTSEEVMKHWMRSYNHRKNILNKNFIYMGIGKATDQSGRIYWCVVFSD